MIDGLPPEPPAIVIPAPRLEAERQFRWMQEQQENWEINQRLREIGRRLEEMDKKGDE